MPSVGYLRMSYFLLLKPFHMILFGLVLPDGEVSPDSHETETEKRLQSKTEDRPGEREARGLSWWPVASGALAWPLSLFLCGQHLFLGQGTVDDSRFHGGPILAVTQPFTHLGLVSAYSPFCLCLQGCCRFGGNAHRRCDCR